MNFIISDLTTGLNKVFIYDERAMGKGCDALCSLRWLYHVRLYIASRDSGMLSDFPDTLYIIMDNCVGQNKSQVLVKFTFNAYFNSLSMIRLKKSSHIIYPILCNSIQAVLMFMSLLSMTLYKRVICHYLISGRSHMMPDRVVSQIKKSFRTNYLYLPNEMIEKMSSIDTVKAELIDHTDPLRQIYTGWEKILKDQLIVIPSMENGYTKNHFYEFADGQVSIRHTVGSEIKYVHNYVITGTESTITNIMLKSIIGDTPLSKATMNNIILIPRPTIEFPKSKISSLSEKYFSILEDKLYYYPSISPNKEHSNPVTNANNRAREAVERIRKKTSKTRD